MTLPNLCKDRAEIGRDTAVIDAFGESATFPAASVIDAVDGAATRMSQRGDATHVVSVAVAAESMKAAQHHFALPGAHFRGRRKDPGNQAISVGKIDLCPFARGRKRRRRQIVAKQALQITTLGPARRQTWQRRTGQLHRDRVPGWGLAQI